MIIELEDAIQQVLADAFKASGPVVASTVDDVSRYKNMGARGTILVRYIGANYIPQRTNLLRTWRFMVLIGMKRFGQHAQTMGAYAALDQTRRLLTGRMLQPETFNVPVRLLPESEGFVQEFAGVWWFQMTFAGSDVLLVQ